jgi:hypothetical protein
MQAIDLSLEDAAAIDLANVVFCELRLLSRTSCARISDRLDNILLYEIQSI